MVVVKTAESSESSGGFVGHGGKHAIAVPPPSSSSKKKQQQLLRKVRRRVLHASCFSCLGRTFRRRTTSQHQKSKLSLAASFATWPIRWAKMTLEKRKEIVDLIMWIFLGSPVWAFIYCLATAYLSERYKTATITHCGSPNFAVSVSEATTVPASSKAVWQTAVFVHSLPRIHHASTMFQFYMATLDPKTIFRSFKRSVEWWISWIYIDWALATIEWLSLLGLTLYTSHNRIFVIHETFTGIFMASSLVHMLTSTHQESRIQPKTPLIKLRKFLTAFNFTGVLLFVYFYTRHNTYCEPFMYSYFCLCEYSVIIANMFYHIASPPLMGNAISLAQKCIIKTRSEKGIRVIAKEPVKSPPDEDDNESTVLLNA